MSHISFSELKNWAHCPYYHKVNHIDGLKSFKGNLFTAFGSALHHVAEKLVSKELQQADAPEEFKTQFFNEVDKLEDKEDQDEKLFEQMIPQGEHLSGLILPALVAEFPNFELVDVEEMLYEDIEKPPSLEIGDKKFKGYIDLIIKTQEGKYIVLDWKTCGWGWDARKKADPMETYFALLKRTAKKDNVEIFRVTSGPKKTKNALKLLHNALYNIERKNFIKNRLKCQRCELYKTQYCT